MDATTAARTDSEWLNWRQLAGRGIALALIGWMALIAVLSTFHAERR